MEIFGNAAIFYHFDTSVNSIEMQINQLISIRYEFILKSVSGQAITLTLIITFI